MHVLSVHMHTFDTKKTKLFLQRIVFIFRFVAIFLYLYKIIVSVKIPMNFVRIFTIYFLVSLTSSIQDDCDEQTKVLKRVKFASQ